MTKMGRRDPGVVLGALMVGMVLGGLAAVSSNCRARSEGVARVKSSDGIVVRRDTNAELASILRGMKLNSREVMIAVSNKNLVTADGSDGMLKTWVDGVVNSGTKNALVVALDDHTASAMKAIGFPYWRRDPNSKNRDVSQNNHGVSGMKFDIIREFLVLDYSVLLSDVDIITLKNPFDYLERDCDVEGMSDGFTDDKAYMWIDGIDDPEMGWSRYAQTNRIFAMNSGLFYLRANERTIKLMERISARLQKEKIWDQSCYNEEIWKPASPYRTSAGVSVRIMDINKFMNSKYLFKFLRHQRKEYLRSSPVMVHVNYHPDKWERMKAIIQRYRDSDMKALDAFPDGSCWHPPDCNPN